MVKQIIFCALIVVFVVLSYNYSANYITGKLELEWLKNGIETNWNLRFIIVLCACGGFVGFVFSKLTRKIIRNKK